MMIAPTLAISGQDLALMWVNVAASLAGALAIFPQNA
jgi:hypothetical protein